MKYNAQKLFFLERELLDKFNHICEENGYNQSGLLRKWIKDFIKKQEENDQNK